MAYRLLKCIGQIFRAGSPIPPLFPQPSLLRCHKPFDVRSARGGSGRWHHSSASSHRTKLGRGHADGRAAPAPPPGAVCDAVQSRNTAPVDGSQQAESGGG